MRQPIHHWSTGKVPILAPNSKYCADVKIVNIARPDQFTFPRRSADLHLRSSRQKLQRPQIKRIDSVALLSSIGGGDPLGANYKECACVAYGNYKTGVSVGIYSSDYLIECFLLGCRDNMSMKCDHKSLKY